MWTFCSRMKLVPTRPCGRACAFGRRRPQQQEATTVQQCLRPRRRHGRGRGGGYVRAAARADGVRVVRVDRRGVRFTQNCLCLRLFNAWRGPVDANNLGVRDTSALGSFSGGDFFLESGLLPLHALRSPCERPCQS